MVKDVEQEGPFTIGLAEIIKGNVSLPVVAVKPVELTALAEAVGTA